MIRALGLVLVAMTALGCSADECWTFAKGGSLGVFLVGGTGGPAEAYMVCESLERQEHKEPSVAPEALRAEGGACAPAGNDDACLACVKVSCCEAAVACVGEDTCACMIACRTNGESEWRCMAEVCDPSGSLNGPSGSLYNNAASCVADHCSTECSRLQ